MLNKANKHEELALDALFAATCRTGALDPEVSLKEARELVEAVAPMAPEDRKAFKATAGTFIEAVRQRLTALEQREQAVFVGVSSQRLYAADVGRPETAPLSDQQLRRAKKRMKRFLGE